MENGKVLPFYRKDLALQARFLLLLLLGRVLLVAEVVSDDEHDDGKELVGIDLSDEQRGYRRGNEHYEHELRRGPEYWHGFTIG